MRFHNVPFREFHNVVPTIRSGYLTSVLIAGYLCLISATAALPQANMTYLDNGEVRVGMDLSLGGAVTHISAREHPGNIINSADLGRQIQMSHYSGPWPFVVGDKKPNKEWAGLGWNPIQTGDCHMNPSRVVEHRNNGQELYIKCIPMQWPMNNVPGDCVFETWTTLDGPVINMRFRCTNQRTDHTAYRPCPQELPAVYTVSRLWRLMSYTGDKPFTGGALSHVTNDWHKPWPWTRFIGTERWAALVNDSGWGLGVFADDGGEFHGGIHGAGRSDDPKHGSTAYVAPVHVENFDYNIVYEYRATFVAGSLPEIRKRCNAMAAKALPSWQFEKDRQHWTLRDAMDDGYPLKGEWRITTGAKKARLESAVTCWRAEQAPAIEIAMACTGQKSNAQISWKRLDDDKFDRVKSATFEITPDGQLHRYTVDLSHSPGYHGLIVGLALEPFSSPHGGEHITIRSIALKGARGSGERQ